MVDNLFVIIILCRSRVLRRKRTTLFIINQSCIDFVVSFLFIATANGNSYVPFEGIMGDLYCKIWSTKLFLWGLMLSSTYNLVILTVERYFQVIHAVWMKNHFSSNLMKILIAAIWLIGPLWNIYKIPTCEVINYTCLFYTKWPSLKSRRIFSVILIMFQFFIPLLILIFCYVRIAQILHSKAKVHPQPAAYKSTNQGNKWMLIRKNTIKTLATVAILFFLCWVWNQFYFLLLNLGYSLDFNNDYYHFTVVMVCINSCINPIIYSLQYKPFQAAVKQTFGIGKISSYETNVTNIPTRVTIRNVSESVT